MSESDKAEFIQDNAKLFSNGKLLEAFESGNYADIETALSQNDALKKQINKRKQEIAQELLIEESRTDDKRNEAYISQLKEYKKYLNDVENLFKASLEIRLEQEKTQLDEYRSYLEDQQEELEKSLNKRKEAYEKYFDTINKEEDLPYTLSACWRESYPPVRRRAVGDRGRSYPSCRPGGTRVSRLPPRQGATG